MPEHFKVTLWPHPNQEETVYRSKAVGEPPLMLAISVWEALRDAIGQSGEDQTQSGPVQCDAPATPERVFLQFQNGRPHNAAQTRAHERAPYKHPRMNRSSAGFFSSDLSVSEVLTEIKHQPAVLIQVMHTKGSAPREAGTWMVASPKNFYNTIGGGHCHGP